MNGSDAVRLHAAELTRYVKLAWLQAAVGALLACVGAAQITVHVIEPLHGGGVLIGLGAVQCACGLGIVVVGLLQRHVLRNACVLLTPEGVVNRLLRDRLIPWTAIAAVETSARGGNWRVRLRLQGGRRVLLAAPATRVSAPDAGFAADRDTLVDWWHRYGR